MYSKKSTRAKAAALVMTLMLTAFTLIMSGCSTDTATDSDTAAKSAGSSTVAWEYVAPSDLKGDTASADAEGEAPSGSEDADMQAKGEAPSSEAPSGEAPSGQVAEKPASQGEQVA